MSQRRGPIRAVILDWAGTTVDYGSRAPARVFVEIFARRGVAITETEARGPMGRAKREHISAVLSMARVAGLWRDVHGRPAIDSDIDAMYDDFLPLQKTMLARESSVIPGVPAAIDSLRARGIRIGSTTGYTRELMEVV
ncbi:MAG TPA: phosphonoacetaldehyde hydrolase, partial [Pirellulaceae bacterium]|nr:phosphonoacetaldehyde hydrolase [Pirellulaceae bacterium]